MDARLQNALKLIDEAFVGVQRDEGCTLHQAQLRDHIGDREILKEEWTAAKLMDSETDWRNVPAHFLDECDAALSHASPQSWHFYLPAYMKRALNFHDAERSIAYPPAGSVIFHLTYDKKQQSLISYHLERFTLLTAHQGQAVVAFLECFRFQGSERHYYADDAEAALSNYWALPPDSRPRASILAAD